MRVIHTNPALLVDQIYVVGLRRKPKGHLVDISAVLLWSGWLRLGHADMLCKHHCIQPNASHQQRPVDAHRDKTKKKMQPRFQRRLLDIVR